MSIRKSAVLVAGLVATVVFLWWTPSLAQTEPTGRKLAFLVGVKQYDHDDLKDLDFPENDVEELATVLQADGFETVVLTTARGKKEPKWKPTAENIRGRLKALLAGATKRDLMIVAFAGHGIQPLGSDDSYFCPADANPVVRNDKPIEPRRLVSIGEILAQLADSGIGEKLLLVDACRNDPSARSARRRGVDHVNVAALPSRTGVLLSCSQGEFSFEEKSLGTGHGVFFYHVIQGLKGSAKDSQGDITWDELAIYVRARVPPTVQKLFGKDGGEQSPNAIGNLRGVPTVLAVAKSITVDNPANEPTAPARGSRASTLARLPAGPPGKPLRWFSVSLHDPRALSKAAKFANIVQDRSWQDSGDALARSAREQGIPVIVAFHRKEYPAVEKKLFDFVRQNRDIVAGVSFLSPYTATDGFTPAQVGEFGQRLKQAFPGISFWVSYIEMPGGMMEPLPAVPPEVDVVEVTTYFAMTPEVVAANVDAHIPNWLQRAGDRPVVFRWVSRPTWNWAADGPLRTAPGTMQKCVEMAVKYKLVGVIFDQFGRRSDNWSPGIESDPTASGEIDDLAATYGFSSVGRAAKN